MTEYVVQSMYTAGFSTNAEVDFTAALKTFLNLTITTDEVGKLVPDILKKYGPGLAVDIKGKCHVPGL